MEIKIKNIEEYDFLYEEYNEMHKNLHQDPNQSQDFLYAELFIQHNNKPTEEKIENGVCIIDLRESALDGL